MRKFLAYTAVAGLLAATGIFATTPAFAAGGTLTVSDSSDLYPGQVISVTLVDTGDPICTDSMIGEEWALGIFMFDADDNLVGGAFAMEPLGNYSNNQTWTTNLQVSWLNDDFYDPTSPTYAMDVTMVGVCQDSPESTSTNVPSTEVPATYTPMTVSSASVAQGGTVDVTVYDELGVWCDENTGSGYSMGVGLFDPNGSRDPIFLPAGVEAGSGVKGFGDFAWDDTEATATVTIPSSVPAGTYTLFVGCITEGTAYLQPGPGMEYYDFVVTPALPDTGLDASGTVTMGLVAGATLLALGAGVFLIRRRLITKP